MTRLPLLVALLAGALAFAAVMVLSSSWRDEPAQVESATTGLGVFNRLGCGSCHRLAAAGSKGSPIGPNLDQRLESHTAQSLKAKILAPGGTGAMPDDFGQRMNNDDLNALVGFLLASRGSDHPE